MTTTTVKPRARKASPKPVRFKSIGETETGTNEEHVEILLKELPWMRMAIALLNLNDRELEAKIRSTPQGDQLAFCQLADALSGIRDRHQACIEVCEATRARIILVLQRLYPEVRKRATGSRP